MSKRNHWNGKKGKGGKSAKSVAWDTASDVCNRASGIAVSAAFERLGPVNTPTDCLDQSNGADVAVLLAAEQVMHLLDAWRYFSSAMTAYLTNSRENATHFSYYCELRSALSLFAGSGIRVRQGDSYLIDAAGAKYAFKLPPNNMRTHRLTWDLWKEWIKRGDSRTLMGDEIKLAPTLSLSEIALIPNATSAVLQAWGYDLLLLSDDHTARNNASYVVRPTESLRFMLPTAPELVRRIWTLLLNGMHGPEFDSALIRYFVRKHVASCVADEQAHGGTKTENFFFDDIADSTAKQVNLDRALIKSLLTEPAEVEVFELAADQKTETENILCRALLLLRFASLSVSKNIKNVPSKSCQDWVRNWLAHAGLFDPEVCDPADLITDYEDALDDFYPNNGATLPRYLWQATDPKILRATSTLTRTEAFVGWGLPV